MTCRTTKIKIRELIAPHFWNSFKSKALHQIDQGGRGSTKTSKNALKICYHLLKEKPCSAICIRKTQKSLRNSVYKEIKRALRRFGLAEGGDFKANLSPLEITLHNGNKIYFAGADDYEKIKGLIDENSPIKLVWFEELTEFDSPEDLDNIVATFSRGNDDWFSALYTFNPPKNKFDWVNQWVEEKKNEGYRVTSSDYRTVPLEWLGDMFIKEAERLKTFDEKRYNWIYLGEVIGMEGLIYNFDHIGKITEQEIKEKELKVYYLDFSIDGGHQTSATTCGCFGYLSDRRWALLDTYYYSPHEKPVKKAPSELSKELRQFQLAMAKKWNASIDRLTVDSAEGAIRNQFFKDYGERLNPVNKGKNKQTLIDYAQDFLAKGRFFVLDNPNNQIFLREAKNYMYKEGSIERGKPEPDKAEHEIRGEAYHNTHSGDFSYYYADHTCDVFQYWVADNMRKLGLKE